MTLQSFPLMPPITFNPTPPSNPIHGQEWILPFDPASGIYWRFFYDAITAGLTYRWVFIGGCPANNVGVNVNNTNTPNGYWPTTGFPSLTIPRAGKYLCNFGGAMGDGNGTLNVAVDFTFQLSVNAGAPLGSNAAGVIPIWPWHIAAASSTAFVLTLNAGDVVWLRANTNVASKNLTVIMSFLEITPACVA